MNISNVVDRGLCLYARHFPLSWGKLRVVDKLWKAAVSNGDTRRTAELVHGGFKMHCDIGGVLQRQFYFFGTYFLEADILTQWVLSAKAGGVILDVGANMGIFSLAALSANPTAIVFAFEPTPEIADKLRATASVNALTQLQVVEAAVSDAVGDAVLRRLAGISGTNEGMNFILTECEGDSWEHVSTVTLDSFCGERNISQVSLLKIDVEGHEHRVLRGAKRMLAAGAIDTVFMELNWGANVSGEFPAAESLDLLASNAYVFREPCDRSRWREAGGWLRSLGNVIASRKATLRRVVS